MIGYLSQGGPYHPKHGGGNHSFTTPPSEIHAHQGICNGRSIVCMTILPPAHPLLVFIVHYSIAISTTCAIHDAFFVLDSSSSSSQDEQQVGYYNNRDTVVAPIQHQRRISQILFIYTVILFSTRILTSYQAGRLRYYSVWYELTWLCNSTLVMSCICYGAWYDNYWLFRRRPLIATSCAVAVSIDQLLWYVDLFVWSISGKFPIGVTKYLTWKQTLWIDRYTSTHHIWTIPLILYGAKESMDWRSFYLSVYVVTCHVWLSRWLTPHVIIQGGVKPTKNTGENEDHKKAEIDPNCFRYLNVNLSHELWKDITLPYLQISKDNPTTFVYLIRLLMRWNLFNALLFVGILRPLSWVL